MPLITFKSYLGTFHSFYRNRAVWFYNDVEESGFAISGDMVAQET